MRRLLTSILLLAACGDFEDPSIVIDMRILGMQASPPEVIAPVDPDDPPDDPSEIELEDVRVCALVADPTGDRRLTYNMVACADPGDSRCNDPDAPFVDVGFGTTGDPETADDPIEMCGTIPGDARLIPVLEEAIREDALGGFGGIPVMVELWVRDENGTLEDAIFAKKLVLYAPQIPAERVANQNPSLETITASVDGAEPVDLPLGRCGFIEPLEVPREGEVELLPIEPEGAREEYVLPTFDGGSRSFTENLRYAWFATHGDWTRGSSGGAQDIAGNEPPLDSTWQAEIEPDVVADGLEVPIWMVQRDERGGQAWYQSCLRVTP